MSLQDLIKHTNENGHAPVDAEAVKSWIIDNHYQDEVHFYPAPFDDDKLRGMIRKYIYHDKPYSDPLFCCDILYSDKLNQCWRRFVCVKEMMHVFDGDNTVSKTPEQIADLADNLTNQMMVLDTSVAALVDRSAQFKALAVLAPIGVVDVLRPGYELGEFSSVDIAKKLMIPEFYITLLFSDTFSEYRKNL